MGVAVGAAQAQATAKQQASFARRVRKARRAARKAKRQAAALNVLLLGLGAAGAAAGAPAGAKGAAALKTTRDLVEVLPRLSPSRIGKWVRRSFVLWLVMLAVVAGLRDWSILPFGLNVPVLPLISYSADGQLRAAPVACVEGRLVMPERGFFGDLDRSARWVRSLDVPSKRQLTGWSRTAGEWVGKSARVFTRAMTGGKPRMERVDPAVVGGGQAQVVLADLQAKVAACGGAVAGCAPAVPVAFGTPGRPVAAGSCPDGSRPLKPQAPAGPGDLERVEVPNAYGGTSTLDARSARMWVAAGKPPIMQGGYTDDVRASGGTHAGCCVMDTGRVPGLSWQQTVDRMLEAGFQAAWHRTPDQGFPHHIHAVAWAGPDIDDIARGQIQTFRNGGDGLAGTPDPPVPGVAG